MSKLALVPSDTKTVDVITQCRDFGEQTAQACANAWLQQLLIYYSSKSCVFSMVDRFLVITGAVVRSRGCAEDAR